MKCKICESQVKFLFTEKVLHKYDVKYFTCNECEFIQTEKPYWLEEAYKNPINLTDTGLLGRNILLAENTAAIIYKLYNKESKYLDYAGGYGVFTRLMRDIGFDFYWNDPFTENIFAKTFELNQNLQNIELVTSFESFEHFENPLDEIRKMLDISSNIFFSTTLIPKPLPKPDAWWYYGFNHGQHIAFYTKKTLQKIASIFGLNVYTNHNFLHLFTDREINPKVFKKIIMNSNKFLNGVIKKKISSKTEADSIMIQEMLTENSR